MPLLLLAGMALAQPTPDPVVADRVLVDVGGELVMQGDIRTEEALTPFDPRATPFWSDPWGPPLQRLVDAAVIRVIAADVALYVPDQQAVSDRVEAVRGQFTSRGDFEAFLGMAGLDEAALRGALRRRLVVDLYLRRTLSADPEADPWAWRLEGTEHLQQLRRRVRIRSIPQAPPPEATP